MNRPLSLHLFLAASMWLIAHPAHGQSNSKNVIEIPSPEGMKVESQKSQSIDFEASPGKGYAATTAWLNQFRALGWTVKTVDEDLPTDGEYKLTKNGVTLEIEFDDSGFDTADIEIKCKGNGVLQLAGSAKQTAPTTNASDKNQEKAISGTQSKETRLGNIAGLRLEIEPDQVPQWWISPDGRRFAHIVGSNLGISIDGKQFDVTPVDESFVFSPDSQHFAVALNGTDGADLMVDGKITSTKMQSIILPIVFSPNSQHFACFATDEMAQSHLLIDGISRGNWPYVSGELAFTSDSQAVLFAHRNEFVDVMRRQSVAAGSSGTDLDHGPASSNRIFHIGPASQVGYIAKYADGTVSFIYEGKEQGARLVDIKRKNIAIAKDASHVVYMGDSTPIRNTMVFHGKRGPEHNPFEDGRIVDGLFAFSDDGKRLAYVLEKDGKQRVVLDGREEPEYQKIEQLGFSPDSRGFFYVADKGDTRILVNNGVKSESYGDVVLPEFSRDGKVFAYQAVIAGKQFVVVNGIKKAGHDLVSRPIVSEDGSTIIYTATDNNVDRMMVNDMAQPEYEIATLAEFYPHSNRFVYLARKDGKARLVDSKKESLPYDHIEPDYYFSQDGKHLGVIAQQNGKEFVVMDAVEGQRYDKIVGPDGNSIRFINNTFYFLAAKEDELYLVESPLP